MLRELQRIPVDHRRRGSLGLVDAGGDLRPPRAGGSGGSPRLPLDATGADEFDQVV